MGQGRAIDARTWTRMNLVLGIVLIVAGILLDTVGLVYESVVAAAGGVVIVAGLVGLVVVLVKDFPSSANLLGVIAIVLGAVLLTHDALLQGLAAFAVHIATGVALVLWGLMHVLGRSSLLRYLGHKSATA